MAKSIVDDVRVDRLGQTLSEGTVVAALKSNTLVIAKVLRFTPKMVKLAPLDSTGYWRIKSEFNVYANDVVCVDEQAVTMYLLRKKS